MEGALSGQIVTYMGKHFARKKPTPKNLKQELIARGRTRWLDVGCGGNFEKGFHYVDLFPSSVLNRQFRDRYFRIDLLKSPESERRRMGEFDLVRMQHVMEHLSVEDGALMLQRCADLLSNKGILLITVPDLEVHIRKYLNKEYRNWKGFKSWANRRINEDAPASFYFSIFAHSMLYESHKWCYDEQGMNYLLESSALFDDIHRLQPDDRLASSPFTHNRPEEDLCFIAVKR